MTKAVGTDTLQQHLRFMNFRSMAGRAVKASKLMNSVTSSVITSAVGGCENSDPVTVSLSTNLLINGDFETASFVAQEI